MKCIYLYFVLISESGFLYNIVIPFKQIEYMNAKYNQSDFNKLNVEI